MARPGTRRRLHPTRISYTVSGMVLVSFDIDGTLEVGDPAGPIKLELVRRAKSLGYIVGSASDRVRSDQHSLWSRHAIEMDFVGHKHKLDEVRERFATAKRFIHIGDTDVDRHYAKIHGFEFYLPDGLPAEGSDGWIF